MNKVFIASWLLALAGCSTPAPAPMSAAPSACKAGETSYACQVERYNNVNVD